MRGLHISPNSPPELITNDLELSKLHVFSQEETIISTFDGKSNYYHYPQNLHNIHPINKLATVLKRLYSNNHTLVVRGDILVYSSLDELPHIIDADVRFDFLQQVILYTEQINEYK